MPKRVCPPPTFRSSGAAKRWNISPAITARSMWTKAAPISVKDALGRHQPIDRRGREQGERAAAGRRRANHASVPAHLSKARRKSPATRCRSCCGARASHPDEFTNRGWATEEKKVFHLVDPLEFARDWQGKHKRRLTSDLDQALVLDWRLLRRQRHQRVGHAEERELQAACRAEEPARMAEQARL